MLEENGRGEGYWTAHRARLFSQAIRQSDFPAQVIKALEPLLRTCRSVLDVGAGVGALTVLLAKAVERVTALEPSPAMRAELLETLARNRLHNVGVVEAPWGPGVVEPHDLILVANVAPIFDDLLPFLTQAEPLARQAIALVQGVGPGAEKFYAGELYPLLLGKPYPGRRDYLHTLTLLHSLGIHAEVRIVAYRFDQPFQDLAEAVRFWTDSLGLETPEQERRLRAFLETRLQPMGERWLAPMRRRSAVLWWPTVPPEG